MWFARCFPHSFASGAPRCLPRCVSGTSTPFSRARLPDPASRYLAAVEVKSPNPVKAAARKRDEARILCEKAHDAIRRRNQRESLVHLWALKDSTPRWSDVQPVADGAFGQPPRTLLQSFAAVGFDKPLKTLLEFGVSVKLKDEEGRTALHLAAEKNHVKAARLLLTIGSASVHARDAQGRTPLHLAAANNSKQVGSLLMNFGAEPMAEDAGERSTIDVARGALRGKKGKLQELMHDTIRKQELGTSRVGKAAKLADTGGTMGATLPADIVAPKLMLTPVGYCPVGPDGKVIQLKRGIRYAKRRQAPSNPNCIVNWYAPRG